jgi:glutamate synthase (NADPH/NADH) small chain
VFNEMDQPPIQIGKLQRYATDHAYEQGWRYFEAGEASGKSVALLGAGPASLAAAHELRRHGHACTIYEKRSVTGGLNTTGVAPYKMKADRSELEADWVLAIGGIEVKHGVEVGTDISLEELLETHDALFLGMGLGEDRYLQVAGEDLSGIYGAVDYIERFKLGQVDLSGVRSAVVIGGGNTAIDAVRELAGLGVDDVTLVYRGQEAAMSGYVHEWKAAKVEGVRGRFQTQPVGYAGSDGVSAVKCVSLDENKQALAGTEHDVPAQLVLLAIGQGKLGELVAGLDGLELKNGCVVVDQNGATGRDGVFAGGDCANGGKEVVNGAAEGKRAARAIHEHLVGG